MYKEADYAHSRITNTIVRLGTEAVFVRCVRDDMSCEVTSDVDSDESRSVHLDELNPLSPPLGFINWRGRVYYLSRRPMRRDWRQGIRPNQLRCMVGVTDITHNMVMDCIRGNTFPTVRYAIGKVVGGKAGVAISRDFALKRNGGAVVLMYKWHKVGIVEDNVIKLNDGCEHLNVKLEALYG
jgi:hypothetical protein